MRSHLQPLLEATVEFLKLLNARLRLGGLSLFIGAAGCLKVLALGAQQRLDILGADVRQHIAAAGVVVDHALEGRLPFAAGAGDH
jgi:hypothetical protein